MPPVIVAVKSVESVNRVGLLLTKLKPVMGNTNSNAPISQVVPCGRDALRWSVVSQVALLPVLYAGLLVVIACVCVVPPLFAKATSPGSDELAGVPHEVLVSMMEFDCVTESLVPDEIQSLPPLELARMLLRTVSEAAVVSLKLT